MLTKREKEVLELICKGYNNIEIAQILYISKHTVKVHVKSITKKLNCRNRIDTAYLAGKERLIII